MKKIILEPSYMKHFTCIGGMCEDTCCCNWKVTIDKETYFKYRKLNKVQLKPLLNKHITRNRSNPSNIYYAKLKHNSDGYCPFLGEDKLCNIYKELGESYLADTCKVYPRFTNIVDDKYERSLLLSCPEAARTVLLNKNLMEFDEIENSEEIKNITYIIDTNGGNNSHPIVRYFWNLRIFCISLIQCRKFKLSERLIILGLFLKKVEEYIDNKKFSEIPSIIEEFTAIIEEGSIVENLKTIPVNYTIQMELSKEFNDQRFTRGLKGINACYVQCIAEFLNGLQYSSDSKVEEMAERYKDSYVKYYKPFVDEHEYILENYLVNYAFGQMFPLRSRDGVFDDYLKLIMHYSLIKTLLIGIAAFHKELNEEIVIKLIYSLTREMDHDNILLRNAFNLVKEKEYNTMAYMAILIKN